MICLKASSARARMFCALYSIERSIKVSIVFALSLSLSTEKLMLAGALVSGATFCYLDEKMGSRWLMTAALAIDFFDFS